MKVDEELLLEKIEFINNLRKNDQSESSSYLESMSEMSTNFIYYSLNLGYFRAKGNNEMAKLYLDSVYSHMAYGHSHPKEMCLNGVLNQIA